jgi:subtilisin family serine protease
MKFAARAAVALALVVAPQAGAQVVPPRQSLDADVERIGASVRAELGAVDDPVRGRMISAILRGPVSAGALRAMGVDVGTQAGDVTTVRMPVSALPAVAKLAGVQAMRLSLPIKLHHDLSIPDIHANNKRTQSPPLLGFNGNNVVVGLVDSGIQYQHDDFKNPDGTTRLYAIWDQRTVGTPPQPYNYGNECSKAQIQAGTCSEVDTEGHGTHTSGTAAGDGSATGNGIPQFKYAGMANKATIVMVKTNFTDSGLIDGVSYIFAKATELGLPAVVNMSLGTNLGPHDGTLDLEYGLDAQVGPGRVIVASSGNEQATKLHGHLVSTVAMDSLTFAVPTYGGSGADDYYLIDGWYESTDNYTITVVSPTGIVYPAIPKGSFFNGANNADGHVYIENGWLSANNGDVNVYIEVSDSQGSPIPRAGGWRIRAVPVSVASAGNIHFWSYSNLSPGYPDAYFATKFDPDMTIGAPATADSIISVGAYVTKAQWTSSAPGLPGPWGFNPPETLGALGSFSGAGPRRDGVMKPDLTAPGSAIASALSTSWVAGGTAFGWSPTLAVDDGKHAVLQGTSMAAPHVTGAVAMMLQYEPTLNPTLIRTRLEQNTRKDSFVLNAGAVPNKKFGYGKLDLTNVVPNVDAVAPSITVTRPNGGETFIANSQDTVKWNASDNVGVTAVDVEYSSNNGTTWTTVATGLVNDGRYLWQVPVALTTQGKVRVTAHDTQNQAQDLSNATFTIGIGNPVGAGDETFAFAVRAPSPSPFSATTAIGFDLPSGPAKWPTTVRIFNVAGKLVRTALAADLDPGPHRAAWDGRDEHGYLQPAGVYFIEVATAANRATVRAVFLR